MIKNLNKLVNYIYSLTLMFCFLEGLSYRPDMYILDIDKLNDCSANSKLLVIHKKTTTDKYSTINNHKEYDNTKYIKVK